MNNNLLKKLLVNLPIFHHLDDDEYRILAFIGKRQEYNMEDELYLPYEPSEGAILISSGRVMIRFEDPERSDILVRRGTLMNEMSMFHSKQYPYHIEIMESIAVVHFQREDFMHLMEEYPEIAHKIQRNIAKRLGVMSAAL